MKPNILLIMTDEQRFDCLGANGNPYIKTPHLDQLAREGVNLQSHTCSSAICTPSRVSVITGQYPRRHQAWHVGYRYDPELPNLAHWFNEAGYLTGMFGKCHWEPELNGNVEHCPADEPYYGFQRHALTEDRPDGRYEQWLKSEHPQHYDELWKSTAHEEQRDPPLGYEGREAFLEAIKVSGLPGPLHQTPWIADHCAAMIRDAAETDQAFMALCSFVDPHHAWSAPQEYLDLYPLDKIPLPKRLEHDPPEDHPIYGYNCPGALSDDQWRLMVRSYYAMITMIDDAVGHLIQQLKDSGQYENTIILFTSDHGDYNGDRGLVRKDCMLTDALMRVPMLIKIPDCPRAGEIITSPTQHEDLAPTLLELAGLEIPASIQGCSLASLLQSRQGKSPRQYAYFEQMFRPAQGLVSYGISDGTWKYSRLWNGQERLIDLSCDLLEFHNRMDDETTVDQALKLKLALCNWLTTQAPGFPDKLYKW